MLDFPVLSTVIHTGKFLKLCVIKIILDFYYFFFPNKKDKNTGSDRDENTHLSLVS